MYKCLKISINQIMTICAVVGCKSSNDKRRLKNPDNIVEVSFCRFPRDEKLRRVWLERCGRDLDCKAKRLFVCIKHFAPKDFVRNLRHELLNYFPKSARKVKIDAVPSLFLPSSDEVDPIALDSSPSSSTNPSPEIKVRQNNPAKNSVDISMEPSEEDPKNPRNKKPIDENLISLSNLVDCEKPELTPPKSPNKLYCKINPKDLEETKLEFIDHVVMVYLNRCRSRAGNTNVGMPNYILKRKAKEAAILLGEKHTDRYQWIDRFKEKMAKNDEKGIILSAVPESLNIADIIAEEWPKFADEKGLDIGCDSEENLSKVDEDECEMEKESLVANNCIDSDTLETINVAPDNENDKILKKIPATDHLISTNSTIEETSSNSTSDPQNNDAENDFLRHVLLSFMKRFNAKWPQTAIPDFVLNGKFREAALALNSRIQHKKLWLNAFKQNIENQILNESNLVDPTQSLDINDIIAEERTNFFLKTEKICPIELKKFERVIMTDEINTRTITDDESNMVKSSLKIEIYDDELVESSDTTEIESFAESFESLDRIDTYEDELDSLETIENYEEECNSSPKIETYEEARDCLNLLRNYALELGDFSAFKLIQQTDCFLRSGDW